MSDTSKRAFPVVVPEWRFNEVGPEACGGMTLREYYAGLAMQGLIADPTCQDSAFAPPHPDYRNEPGWVLARKALGWSEPSEPCENPGCDGCKGEETFNGAHRCFKDGRWLDDGSEM